MKKLTWLIIVVIIIIAGILIWYTTYNKESNNSNNTITSSKESDNMMISKFSTCRLFATDTEDGRIYRTFDCRNEAGSDVTEADTGSTYYDTNGKEIATCHGNSVYSADHECTKLMSINNMVQINNPHD
ncbi:hypothetical protein KKF61_02775 [Patescibacteria group bacterium]|nr:hypothetical protein [Patescibacteria group bacterium]MBU0963903.1 hypothetical protein [Patescibacteria group bacterium]